MHIEFNKKEWNIPALKTLFEPLGLAPGMAQMVTQGKEEPIQELQRLATVTIENLVIVLQNLHGGMAFWGKPLLTDPQKFNNRTQTLLTNLDVPTIQENLSLLKPEQQKLVHDVMSATN